jgi:hypothetical protein
MKKLLAAVLLAASLAACGGGNDEPTQEPVESPSESAATADLPQCSEVWVDGKTLPSDYDGCVRDDGNAVAADVKPCGSGPEQFARYETTDEDDIAYPYIAILGEKVIEYTDDENGPYAKLFNKCDPS